MAKMACINRFPVAAKYKAYSIPVPPSLFERFRTGPVTGKNRQGEQAVPIKALSGGDNKREEPAHSFRNS